MAEASIDTINQCCGPFKCFDSWSNNTPHISQAMDMTLGESPGSSGCPRVPRVVPGFLGVSRGLYWGSRTHCGHRSPWNNTIHTDDWWRLISIIYIYWSTQYFINVTYYNNIFFNCRTLDPLSYSFVSFGTPQTTVSPKKTSCGCPSTSSWCWWWSGSGEGYSCWRLEIIIDSVSSFFFPLLHRAAPWETSAVPTTIVCTCLT